MWICRKCKAKWEFSQLSPEVDVAGCHFICPACGGRNPLVNVGSGERIELMQPTIDWTTLRPFHE